MSDRDFRGMPDKDLISWIQQGRRHPDASDDVCSPQATELSEDQHNAFDELVFRWTARLRQNGSLRGLSPDDVDDVIQATWEKVFVALAGFQWRGAFRFWRWFIDILRNTVIDRFAAPGLRSQWRRGIASFARNTFPLMGVTKTVILFFIFRALRMHRL